MDAVAKVQTNSDNDKEKAKKDDDDTDDTDDTDLFFVIDNEKQIHYYLYLNN